ncbi:unnamed protein product [Thlaspi arvense]|uniref:F-box associated beta-propeller type 1 domain-containing protein n=1 Tax=Thlaspi arvense TaxID=13288 RepID=A0AAU9SJ79_THLAR|nr:unnamed protein product [Thlaspi arvense]
MASPSLLLPFELVEEILYKIPVIYDFYWNLHPIHQNVPMNGNMYWVAYRMNTEAGIFIQSFDFSTETFKPICCNVPIATGRFHVINNDHAVLFSGFKGDRLSLLHQLRKHGGIEVWVTNKVTDEVVSWSKCFNVTRPGLPVLESKFQRTLLTYFIHNKTNNIMLWCEEEDAKGRYVNIYEISILLMVFLTVAMFMLQVWSRSHSHSKSVCVCIYT